jgi:hypothetical protein
MSRPVNGKTVEIRLIIFRAKTLQILAQIYYYTLADFSSARSRVDGLHSHIICALFYVNVPVNCTGPTVLFFLGYESGTIGQPTFLFFSIEFQLCKFFPCCMEKL